jgi:hypothetical protein
MLKPSTWREWASLSRTNAAAYEKWQAADLVAKQETDPSDWIERWLEDCPGRGQTYLRTHRQIQADGGTSCVVCGFRTQLLTWNSELGKFEPSH